MDASAPPLEKPPPFRIHWPQIILSNTSLRYLSSMYAPPFHHMVAVRTCLSCPHLRECDWPWTSAAALKQGTPPAGDWAQQGYWGRRRPPGGPSERWLWLRTPWRPCWLGLRISRPSKTIHPASLPPTLLHWGPDWSLVGQFSKLFPVPSLVLFCFVFVFLAPLCGWQHLSCPTRDWTQDHRQWKCHVLTPGPQGNSLLSVFSQAYPLINFLHI